MPGDGDSLLGCAALHSFELLADWQKIKGHSVTERKSMQELLELGLNEIPKKKGLAPIQGIPHDKKRGK